MPPLDLPLHLHFSEPPDCIRVHRPCVRQHVNTTISLIPSSSSIFLFLLLFFLLLSARKRKPSQIRGSVGDHFYLNFLDILSHSHGISPQNRADRQRTTDHPIDWRNLFSFSYFFPNELHPLEVEKCTTPPAPLIATPPRPPTHLHREWMRERVKEWTSERKMI